MHAVAILAHLMDAEGSLGVESLARIEKAIELDRSRRFDLFLTSGWDYRDDSSLKIGDVVAKKLVDDHSIDPNRVLVDVNSRDTVGDAYFLRRNIIRPRGIVEITVVTSDYHVGRANRIFQKFLSPDVAVETVGAPLDLAHRDQLAEREEKSLVAFEQTFRGVDFANEADVCRALAARHPFYNGDVYQKLVCG